jgi:putative CocE/NonD family hydrolase
MILFHILTLSLKRLIQRTILINIDMRKIALLTIILHIAVLSFAQDKNHNLDINTLMEGYTKQEVMIPMRDGAKLYTAVYCPKTSTASPVIMTRTPYSCSPYGQEFSRGIFEQYRHFAANNYYIVVQDVRGRNSSEGEFVNIRPYSAKPKAINDATDVYDTIDYLISNYKTNGNVGVMGVSYLGYYATYASLCGHPALKAVSPQAPICDWFIGDDVHHNGAFMAVDILSFSSFFYHGKGRPGKEAPVYPITKDAYQALKGKPLSEIIGLLGTEEEIAANYNFIPEIINHPDYDKFWKDRRITSHLKNIAPAVLVVGGTIDAEDCYGAVETYREYKQRTPATPLYFAYGPWPHGYWNRPHWHEISGVDFGKGMQDHYMREVEYAFFSHYLEGKDTTPSPVTIYASQLDNSNPKYHLITSDTWPPKGKEATCYLRSDSSLTTQSSDNSSRTYISDPSDPVRYSAVQKPKRDKGYLAEDQSFLHGRKDVLSYVSEVLTDTLKLMGPMVADIDFITDAKDIDLVVKLIDVAPDGFEMLVRGEVLRARYRKGFDSPKYIKPGKRENVNFTLNDIAHYVLPGHKLMVQIQSSWFPLVDMNPQTAVKNIYKAKAEDYKPAKVSILGTSSVSLHVAD